LSKPRTTTNATDEQL